MTNVIEDVETKRAYALLVGMYTGATHMNTYCGGYSRNLKELLCDALSHFWIYSQRK